MSTFAPVYRPNKSQQAFLTHEQKREAKKRKREDDDEQESDGLGHEQSSSSDDLTPRKARGFVPVNRTDPFLVAGLSREQPVPRFPFPHAPVKSSGPPRRSSQEELAAVKPPLYVAKTEPQDQSTSLKRKHLDNLTVILHRCMLAGDWDRASRTWGLLVRTEVGGQEIDVRQHGRWGIGAEILMRRGHGKISENPAKADNPGSDDVSMHDDFDAQKASPQLPDEGFKLAREYYERLVLQYPYTPHSQHTVNSRVFYPALFNVWVYEVQARYKRLREEAARVRRSSIQSTASDVSNRSRSLRDSSGQDLTRRELEDALPIADRLDQLLLSPPYDVSEPLLHLRSMMAIWLSDIYASLARARSYQPDDSSLSSPTTNVHGDYADRVATEQNRQKAIAERKRAKELLAKVKALGSETSRDFDLGSVEAEDDLSE